MSQQSAALVEEAAAATESLEEQAQNLPVAVATFGVDESGSRADTQELVCQSPQ